MPLTLEKTFIIATWIPTFVTYVMHDIGGALILLGADVVVILIYVFKDYIRSNIKLISMLNKIF